MNQKKTGALLTAALVLSVLSAAAQQSSENKDTSRKQFSHSWAFNKPARDRSWVNYNKEQAKIDRMQAELEAIQRKLDQVMLRSLIGDLVTEKVLADKDQFVWLALTEDKLIVNGKTQSRALHKEFKMKYIHKAGFGIFYGNPPKSKSDASEEGEPLER